MFHNVIWARERRWKRAWMRKRTISTITLSNSKKVPRRFPAGHIYTLSTVEIYSMKPEFHYWGSDFLKSFFHTAVKKSLKHCENIPWNLKISTKTSFYDVILGKLANAAVQDLDENRLIIFRWFSLSCYSPRHCCHSNKRKRRELHLLRLGQDRNSPFAQITCAHSFKTSTVSLMTD